MFPRSWNGGESLKLRLRKPTAVVIEVRKTGLALTRIASTESGVLRHTLTQRIEPCHEDVNRVRNGQCSG